MVVPYMKVSKSVRDLRLATKVIDAFRLQRFCGLRDLFLGCHVGCLADLCKACLEESHRFFGFDPAYYISAASFGLRAMLKRSTAHSASRALAQRADARVLPDGHARRRLCC